MPKHTQQMWDLTASIDFNYTAANFWSNQQSRTWLDILATDRPAELHYELNCGAGPCPAARETISSLNGKSPRDYVTINILNKKRVGLFETLNKLFNTITDKAGDVFTNDITTRKTTYWLVEQLSRTVFGIIDGASDDSSFATPDLDDRNYARIIRTISSDFTEEYQNKLSNMLTDYSNIKYAETRWTNKLIKELTWQNRQPISIRHKTNNFVTALSVNNNSLVHACV